MAKPKDFYKTSQKGIEARKQVKKLEFERRSKLKNNLKKLLKEEGYSETPAPNPTDKLPKQTQKQKQTQKPKPNPFKQKKEKIVANSDEKEEKAQKLAIAQQKRREVTIQLSKRTKKGQPVMSNIINNLLGKIQAKS